jgi:recombination protein RecA
MPIGNRAAALRLQVETALAGRVAAPLEYRNRQVVETVSAGIGEIDELTGGLPRGCLTEIFGEPCSGRTSLLLVALAERTKETEVCALVDGRDSFDPAAALAAGVNLRQLLWVRCKNIDQALRATDLLIQGGGFGLIALDLSDVPPRLVRQVPLNVWFRFRRAVENTPTILFLMAQESNAKTCASLVLRMEGEAGVWQETAREAESSRMNNAEKKLEHAAGSLLEGAKSWAEVVRSRMQSEDGQPKANRAMKNRVSSIDARRIDSKRINAAKFELKPSGIIWMALQRSHANANKF